MTHHISRDKNALPLGDFADDYSPFGYVFRVGAIPVKKPEWDVAVCEFKTRLNNSTGF